MQFSDTSTKSGLIQECERWCRFPDAGISGDATTLAEFTTRINSAFERLIPSLLAFNDQVRWDDLNHTDAPIGYVNLASGQNDYKITTDDNSLDILNVTKVRILTSATATTYKELTRINANDPQVADIMSPATGDTGTPSGFLEIGNVIYLDILPDYSATNGIEIFFGRQQSYFATSDTTKEPGFPLPFHRLLALIASLEWNQVNRSNDTNLLTILSKEIERQEKKLDMFINLRHPSKRKMTPRLTPFI